VAPGQLAHRYEDRADAAKSSRIASRMSTRSALSVTNALVAPR